MLGRITRLGVAVLLAWALLPLAGSAAYSTDLFFSEYVEGNSNNKALEIYNATAGAVDLTGYSIEVYNNGATTPNTSVELASTSLASGGVWVLMHGSADAANWPLADQLTPTSVGWFNGNDAVVLRHGGTIVDVIGQVGFDPGTEWGSGLVSTQDNTIRRLPTVCAGDANPSDSFNPLPEWEGFAQNTFDGLGAHTSDCVPPPEPADPIINEFSADTYGDDVEYVEILGDPDTSYAGYTLLEIEGDDTMGLVDEVVGLGTTDADGYLLMALTTNSLENGTLTLLLVEGFTGFLGDDLDTNDDGALDVTPWVELIDAVAVNDGGAGDLIYYGPGLGPNFDGLDPSEPGGASRLPNGTDTETTNDWKRNDFDLAGIPGHTGTPVFGEAVNTPEAVNQAVPEGCGDPYLAIPAVQGDGAASPLVGASVAVEGVVVGDFQTGGLNGYHLQDFPGDGNAATSDGVFIYAPGGTAVSVGDQVRVRGTVSEYNGLTEITAAQVWVCSTGQPVAATTLNLPLAGPDALEAYEGMLVTFPQTLHISEYFDFDRYGKIVLTTARQYQPTALYEPGSPERTALAAANALARITLDDGRTAENPDPARHPNGADFTLANRFRGGDTLTGVAGVVDYASGEYRIQPTSGATYAPANPRPAAPGAVGGNIKVASFNVLNYFTTLGSRGANTAEEFTRQRDKIIAALATINADIVGLIEIENNTAAIADLVSGLNFAMGAGTYAAVNTGVIGSDQIKVALIYKPASVSLLGGYEILDSTDDPRFIDTRNRPALAQSFQEVSGSGIFTVVVNHLKSKGSECSGDPDLGDGAGNCNLTRRDAALALVDWLASDPTGSGDPDFLIIGDLNAYAKEDPIDALLAGGYTDLLNAYLGGGAYSYLFDGQLGYLDHALAGGALLDQVTGTTVWHINADEPDLLDYDMTYKAAAQDALYEPNAYRSSDHDAIVVGLDLDDAPAPGDFSKTAPDNVATGVARNPALSWSTAAGAASYEYCYDTTNDAACGGSWVSTGSTTSAALSGLAYSTTYYWQVRAIGIGGTTNADGGVWWSFTTTGPTLLEMSFRSQGAYDGWVLEKDEDSGKGGTFDAAGATARLGDDALDRQYRAILDFNTEALPDNAVIVGVTVRVKKEKIFGSNPFDCLGLLTVDMKTGFYTDAQVLEKYDFHAVGSRGNVGRFIKTASAGWYRAPLRAPSYLLVSLVGTTQFRLRFATDDNENGVADYLSFYTGNAAEADRPELVVTYYVP